MDIDVPSHPLRAAAEVDQGAVIRLIERYSGLRSRWGGVIWVRDALSGQSGQKHRWCGISIREDVLLHRTRRWRTMIHEGLHSVSAVFSAGRLEPQHFAWEEAIVEQAQRLLRPTIVDHLGLALVEDDFLSDDNLHPLNAHIARLEQHRTAVGEESEPFYVRLLGTDKEGRAREIIATSRAYGARQEDRQG